MRAIVSDYSRPGDLVCDPTAGYGSTLAAALQKGRRAIGAEVDPEVYAEARKRLDLVQAGPEDMFDPSRAKQSNLF
jgi:site-specific DNA-methyltransferase (adenine-specific)